MFKRTQVKSSPKIIKSLESPLLARIQFTTVADLPARYRTGIYDKSCPSRNTSSSALRVLSTIRADNSMSAPAFRPFSLLTHDVIMGQIFVHMVCIVRCDTMLQSILNYTMYERLVLLLTALSVVSSSLYCQNPLRCN